MDGTDSRKIEYLKKRLEQALKEGVADDINNCWQELKSVAAGADLVELENQVANFNKKRTERQTRENADRQANAAERMHTIDKRLKIFGPGRIAGLIVFFGFAILSLLCVVVSYDGSASDVWDYLVFVCTGLAGLGAVIALLCAIFYSLTNPKWGKCIDEVFECVCLTDPRLVQLAGATKTKEPHSELYKAMDENGGFGACVQRHDIRRRIKKIC